LGFFTIFIHLKNLSQWGKRQKDCGVQGLTARKTNNYKICKMQQRGKLLTYFMEIPKAIYLKKRNPTEK